MIIDLLLNMLSALLDWAISIRPQWVVHLPSSVSNLVGTLMSYDGILPVTEIMTVLGLTCTLLAAYSLWKWTVKLIDWIADVIP